MATVLINYASAGFKRRQRMNAYSAIVKGGVDYCIRYQPHHLSVDFTDSNRFLMSASRGAGLFIWKPHIILDAMDKTDPGDIIIYCDSGAVITSSLQPLAEVCRNLTSGVLGFEVGEGFVDRQWTKRDAFTLMKCDLPAYTDTPQLRGGTIVFVNCKASRRFVEQWSEHVCQVRLVTDLPSTCGLPEYPDFKAHRHDQSLFSLLYKKHGFPSCEKLTGKHLGEVMQCHIKTEPSLMKLMPTYFSPRLSHRFSLRR